jgi:hypothetical protein
MPDVPKKNQVGGCGPSFQWRERPEQHSLLRSLNKRHADFHAEQGKKLQEQLTETTLKMAMDQRESEAARGISIGNWSFERAIDDAAKASAFVKEQQARNAGRSKKTDALQELIVQIVRDNPKISESQLLVRLMAMEKLGVIEDIDGEGDENPSIHFDQRGRCKEAAVSGLKDRLTRARKVVRNELAPTR